MTLLQYDAVETKHILTYTIQNHIAISDLENKLTSQPCGVLDNSKKMREREREDDEEEMTTEQPTASV